MATERVRALLARLEIPPDPGCVLGVWPTAGDGVEVHLSPATFWRTVKRWGLAVTSTEAPEFWFPHRHAFATSGVEFLTFSREPVLPPGVLTPGYAVRLT